MVQGALMRCDHTLRPLHANVSLHEELVSPADLYRPGGLDRLMLGMTVQSSQNRDEFMTEELTNRLFQTSRKSIIYLPNKMFNFNFLKDIYFQVT